MTSDTGTQGEGSGSPDAPIDVKRLVAALNEAHKTVGARGYLCPWTEADVRIVAAQYERR